MRIKDPKKLALTRDTIRSLSERDLRVTIGGGSAHRGPCTERDSGCAGSTAATD
jgi:hypothetical protein